MMKNIFATLVLFVCCCVVNAQEVVFKEAKYQVKGEKIMKDGKDVTKTLSAEDQKHIKDSYKIEKTKVEKAKAAEKMEAEKAKAKEKAVKQEEKAKKEKEKDVKKAEKAQKKSEKELKAKEKAKSTYEKAEKKHESAVAKYEKLKKKGKLSPVDEKKSLDKIEKLNEKVEKAKRKL